MNFIFFFIRQFIVEFVQARRLIPVILVLGNLRLKDCNYPVSKDILMRDTHAPPCGFKTIEAMGPQEFHAVSRKYRNPVLVLESLHSSDNLLTTLQRDWG